jgi:hypothetical protein
LQDARGNSGNNYGRDFCRFDTAIQPIPPNIGNTSEDSGIFAVLGIAT